MDKDTPIEAWESSLFVKCHSLLFKLFALHTCSAQALIFLTQPAKTVTATLSGDTFNGHIQRSLSEESEHRTLGINMQISFERRDSTEAFVVAVEAYRRDRERRIEARERKPKLEGSNNDTDSEARSP